MMQSGRKLREGVTTGACAAAAAKAAAVMFLTGRCPEHVSVTGPSGRTFTMEAHAHGGGCCVIKDAGDDIDVTDGAAVCASLDVSDGDGDITFAAGSGVGVITLPGLKLPVGEPAVNPVPRRMIADAVRSVLGTRAVRVTVSVPGGEELAKRTFNPRLGVEGGLSILGTTGVVRPMDESALLESLTLEISVIRSLGADRLAFVFGGTGEAAARSAFGLTGRCVVQTGNYPGHALDEAHRMGFRECVVCGHPGKLLKIAAGSFLTHNRAADGRLEALCTCAAIMGAPPDTVRRIYECRTAENAMSIVRDEGLDAVWDELARIAARRCTDRNFGGMIVEAAFIDSDGKIIGRSGGFDRVIADIAQSSV